MRVRQKKQDNFWERMAKSMKLTDFVGKKRK